MKVLEGYAMASWFYLIGGLSATILAIVVVVGGTQHIWYEAPLLLIGLMAIFAGLGGILPSRQRTASSISRGISICFAIILILRCILGLLFSAK